MGLFDFVGKIVNSTVQTVVVPIAIVKDLAEGEVGTNTIKQFNKVGKSVNKAFKKL